MRPVINKKSKIVMKINREGLIAYCNQEAILDLSSQLSWIGASDPKDHFECHVLMTLENDESKFGGKSPKNVRVVFDDGMDEIFSRTCHAVAGFELTFMIVEECDFKKI
jgi:hypothetical protein